MCCAATFAAHLAERAARGKLRGYGLGRDAWTAWTTVQKEKSAFQIAANSIACKIARCTLQLSNVPLSRAVGDSFEVYLTCEPSSRAGRCRKIAVALDALCGGSPATANCERSLQCVQLLVLYDGQLKTIPSLKRTVRTRQRSRLSTSQGLLANRRDVGMEQPAF